MPRPGGVRAEGRPQGAADRRVPGVPLVARGRPAEPSRQEGEALCLGCHPANAPAFTKAHGGYPVDQASCSGCHSPHSSTQPKLLKTSLHAPVAARSATTCHAAPASGKPFDVNQGRRTVRGVPRCGRHEGHREGTARAVQGRPVPLVSRRRTRREPVAAEGQGNALCATCHKEQAAAVAFKHAPVARPEGCLSCHGAHSTDNEQLLTASPARSACPATRRRRRRSRRRRSQHAPAAADECATCHDAHGSNVKGILKDRMDRVCYGCHADAETNFLKTYAHQPVREGDCASCHEPHGAEGKLLKAAGAKLCESCHADLMKPIEGGRRHEPFVEGSASPATTRTPATSRAWRPTTSARSAPAVTPTSRRRWTRASRSTSRRQRASARPATTRTRPRCRGSCWRRAPTCASPATRS